MLKTHWKRLTHPDYLGAYELMDGSEQAKEMVVKIAEIKRQEVVGADGKKEQCTVAHLVGVKPMILNATNQKTMTKLFGSPYVEDWAGKLMTLYVAKVKAFGDTVDALRVKTTAPVITLPELTPDHPRWAGALQAVIDGNTTIQAIEKNFTLSEANKQILVDAATANI